MAVSLASHAQKTPHTGLPHNAPVIRHMALNTVPIGIEHLRKIAESGFFQIRYDAAESEILK